MADQVFVKYCPLCGAENSRRQAFCVKCLDGDLSMVPDEPRRAPKIVDGSALPPVTDACSETVTIELLEDPHIAFHVREGQTIGRTDKADIVLTGVPKLDWISGAHARFSRRGAQWYVQHIGSTNYIKVDGEKYEGNQEVAIYDQSILVLSLTSFRVRVGAVPHADHALRS